MNIDQKPRGFQKLFTFEHHNQPLLTQQAFLKRQLNHIFVVLGIIVGSLFVGMLGYHLIEGLSWVDAFLNSAMLLGGMGPVDQLHTTAGKIFAGFYALYSGIVFLVVAGVLFAPIFHRMLHHFHLDMESKEE
jgi:ABC-type glycerol-3-phosphate transport system permease component